MMDLSPQQTQALNKVADWYRNPTDPFRLFGYAGTGKTTIAKAIVEHLGLTGLYAAYTGKATHVLRTKGCEPSYTIHSLIYLPRERARSRLRELRSKLDRLTRLVGTGSPSAEIDDLKSQIRAEELRLATPTFLLRTPQESRLTSAPLLVVDEVSMVNERMARDLVGFNVPLLVLGDPAQLPPVEGEGWFIDHEPDHLLTEVHRTALDSPVTRIATAIRGCTDPTDTRLGVRGMDEDSGRTNEVTRADLDLFDQVLCGTNPTRWQAIRTIRRLQGYDHGSAPSHGDKIIVLTNNADADVYNGQQFTIMDSTLDGDHYEMYLTSETGEDRELNCWRYGFTGLDGERRARIQGGRGETVAATYAHAITVHKAQGSQWPKVLVIDESGVFTRMANGPAPSRYLGGKRWLYTGVTRASEQVLITGAGVVR